MTRVAETGKYFPVTSTVAPTARDRGTEARTRVTFALDFFRTTFTVTAALSSLPDAPTSRVVAVILARPGRFAFTTPLALTVATFGFDDVHAT